MDRSFRDVPLPGLTGAIFDDVDVGPRATRAIVDDPQGDRVYCWGEDASKLGEASPEDESFYVMTPPPDVDLQALMLGEEHACALVGMGEVWCWGDNTSSQVSSDDISEASGPVLTVSGSDASSPYVAISAGGALTCVQKQVDGGGEILCWGSNVYGQANPGGEIGHSLVPIKIKVP